MKTWKAQWKVAAGGDAAAAAAAASMGRCFTSPSHSKTETCWGQDSLGCLNTSQMVLGSTPHVHSLPVGILEQDAYYLELLLKACIRINLPPKSLCIRASANRL